MSEITNLPANRSSTLPDTLRRTWKDKLRPAPVTETVAKLSTCLALVKPVGMSAEDTQAWLRVAAAELAHLPPDMLERGCATARRTCTHHGQIVPAILKDVGPWYADVAEGARIAERMAKPVEALPEPEPWNPTQAELEEIKANAAKALTAR